MKNKNGRLLTKLTLNLTYGSPDIEKTTKWLEKQKDEDIEKLLMDIQHCILSNKLFPKTVYIFYLQENNIRESILQRHSLQNG